MIWDLRKMTAKWKIVALVGSFVMCAVVLGATFRLLKKLGVL